MANIFPPNTNRRFYGGVALIALAAALALGGVYYVNFQIPEYEPCLLYTSPSPRD